MFKRSSVFSFFPKRPALHEVILPNTFFKSTSGNALKSPKFWVFLYLNKSWAASKNLTPTVSRSVIFCAAIRLLRMSVPGLWSSYRIIEKGQCLVIHRLTVRHPWAEIFLWFFQLQGTRIFPLWPFTSSVMTKTMVAFPSSGSAVRNIYCTRGQ